MDDTNHEVNGSGAAQVEPDSSSPLALIRAKELEISGRVLAAKREADGIVADARRQAADIIGAAEAEGGIGAADAEAAIRGEAEREAVRLIQDADAEVLALVRQAESRREEAAQIVLDAVTRI